MSSAWWRFARLLARVVVFLYYRSFRVEHRGRIPAEGPVLFVLNHPNSLLDPAALLLASPRPVRFAAKGPLFRTPGLGLLLRRLGAIPVERPADAGSDLRRNLSAFGRFAAALREGGACAIFPEGLSHEDPELKTVKSGPARIALEAEEGAAWGLGLRVVPVGLTFHPRRVFRGEVVVRVGEPFRVDDLREEHRHRAIREVQDRIGASLRPLVHHLERVDLAPLVEGAATVLMEHRAATGERGRTDSREEVVRAAGACLNHFLAADPAAVEEVRRALARYGRLSGRAGISRGALELRERPARALAAFLGTGVVLVAGFPLFLAGVLAGLVPYRLTDRISRRLAPGAGGPTTLPLLRVGVGALLFGPFWGALAWLFHGWSGSAVVTAVFVAFLAAAGLFARFYATRVRSWRERLESLLPFFLRKEAVRRVALVRAGLVARLQDLVRRYETETGEPLLPAPPPPRRRFPWKRAAAVVAAGAAAWFLAGLRGTGMESLAEAPSPWRDLPAGEARRTLDGDAKALAGTLDTMEALEGRMDAMRAEFDAGRRDFHDPATDAAVRSALLTYLTCREGLLRLAWHYREPDRPGEPDASAGGFLAGYAAAVELCARGMQFVDTFDGHPDAVRKLNEGDPSWEIPPGVFDRVRRNLADTDLLDALAAATARFEEARAAGRLPAEPPWDRIAARAADGAAVTGDLADRLWTYKWRGAMERARSAGDRGRYAASSVVSTWIGDARVRARPGGHGLISREQVEALRAVLRPGDIVVERRNWYLSNAFLPGFWKHAALFVGGPEGLATLGVADDPRVAPHLAALGEPDPEGHRRVVLEAISEGVVFTSLEESVGGADAVCVFRPRIPPERLADAVARAVRHHGKPYDFDFDFFSTDRLVCTEVVYQGFQEEVGFDLEEILGRRTLPALEIVRRWDPEGKGADGKLELVAFLDADEAAGVAREADAATLRASLDRPGLTPLQEGTGGRPLLASPGLLALLAMLAAGAVAFRRRP